MFISLIVSGVVLGVFSTLLMDLSGMTARKLKLHPGGSYAVIGRWVGGFFQGRFAYKNILQQKPLKHEVLIGIVAHYLIGMGLAVFYLMIVSSLRVPAESFIWALGYGLLTNLLPWFVMFPALGFGVLARRGPPNNSLLKSSFWNHVSFGVALFVGAFLIKNVAL